MLHQSAQLEEQAVLGTAARMVAAARTAPKTRGADNIISLVLTGEDKDALADKMDQVAYREFGQNPSNFHRDAENLRRAFAVVLIGIRRAYTGLPFCSFCGFENCGACKQAKARCAFNFIDLGLALGSAVEIAAQDHVDNRIMFSVGKVAQEMNYSSEDVIWQGIPLSVTGKNIFFDRG